MASHPPVLSELERRELFELYIKNIPDPEVCLQKWFPGSPVDEIRRENLKDFFRWVFFSRSSVPGDEEEEIDEFVDATEELLGRRVELGRGSAQCLQLTLVRVDVSHCQIMQHWVSQASSLHWHNPSLTPIVC